jgi:GNAT superfamily N-acetyltransferase
MYPEITVETATIAEISVLVNLVNGGAYRASEGAIWHGSFERTNAEDLNKIIEKKQFFVAVKNDNILNREIIGCVSLMKLAYDIAATTEEAADIYEFGYLCVITNYQRKGIAKHLINYCKEKALSLSLKEKNPSTSTSKVILQCELLVSSIYLTIASISQTTPNAQLRIGGHQLKT